MRLDVLEGEARRGAEGRQRPDLVQHVGRDLLGRRPEVAPAETDAVGEAGVRAHGDPVSARRLDTTPHRARVPRVEAAGHIRG